MLRWRLLVGLVSIVVLLLAAGGYSIWLLARMERSVDSLLTENYESIREAHSLRLLVLRLNAYYFRDPYQGFFQTGTEPLEETFEPPIERALTALKLLARDDEEKKVVDHLEEQMVDYLKLFRTGFELGSPESPAFQDFRRELLSRNLSISETTEEILKINEYGMFQAQKRTSQLVGDTIRFLACAMAVSLAVFAYTYIRLGRSLITPIEDLRRSIEAVKRRNFEQNIPVMSNDELGDLAVAFNEMAGELRAYRRDTDDTILLLNQSIRETIAAFPYPVILLDSQDEIWVTNQAAERFLESLGSSERLPNSLLQQLGEVRRLNQDYLPDGLNEAMLFRLDERELHFLPRIIRIFSPEGDIAGAAVILIDVSRFRWLDEMKSNLISTVSHEIKTPLTGIRMMLHLLVEKSCGELNPMQEEMIESACNDCERLLATLNSLLELSRIEAGRAHLNLEPVNARELLEDAKSAFEKQAQARDLSFAIDAKPDLPNVLVDRARITHVLGNFVSNALKFAPDGSTVELSADRMSGDFVRLSVADSGPGIPEQYHARIFDKFFRPPTQKVDGVGLGLSIAREIVHAHDGRIGFTSDPGRRTQFYCELPIA